MHGQLHSIRIQDNHHREADVTPSWRGSQMPTASNDLSQSYTQRSIKAAIDITQPNNQASLRSATVAITWARYSMPSQQIYLIFWLTDSTIQEGKLINSSSRQNETVYQTLLSSTPMQKLVSYNVSQLAYKLINVKTLSLLLTFLVRIVILLLVFLNFYISNEYINQSFIGYYLLFSRQY